MAIKKKASGSMGSNQIGKYPNLIWLGKKIPNFPGPKYIHSQ
jgi:hypothetical protein